MRENFDIQEIKDRLSFLRLMEIVGLEMRRSGPNFVAPCPFHAERSASFTVHASSPEHGHCYGCGWHGDIFDFWQSHRGGDLNASLATLASFASVGPTRKSIDAAQVPQLTRMAERREKPPLPRMRALNREEIEALAALRKLSPAGIAAAAADKRVGFCMWPQFLDHRNVWMDVADSSPAWVVTDSKRAVAQFRKMDGGHYLTKEGRQIKAWTKGSPTWPIGASEIGDRNAVIIVEGGADMLAGYHFLEMFGRLRAVAVCAMLGASMRIAEDALGFFRRKRVRIIMDEDEPKDERGIRPGCEAAARWTGQLIEAGAAVETFSLAGLVKGDGSKVKDLNDLAAVDESAWLDPQLKAAFFDFDF